MYDVFSFSKVYLKTLSGKDPDLGLLCLHKCEKGLLWTEGSKG